MDEHNFTNNKLILKNTLMLYIRQILILFVTLFTSRIVLKALGSVDFGIYNLVGGIATMLGFLSSAMVVSCQRYFSFYIGKRDNDNLSKVFVTSLGIYSLICIFILLFAETIGIWFINTQLVIPENRIIVANVVYQFSLISFIVTVLGTPFTAIIVAYEKMEIYARISVLECFLKVFMAYMLNTILIDKLGLYGLFMMIITIIITSCYIIY
ncbi:lipopolysaccharide biosynthesis protein, partial [bacterium]|nr:lipopolysaccharide biosynthesis protein [bacterium]